MVLNRNADLERHLKTHSEKKFVLLFSNSFVVIDIYFVVNSRVLWRAAGFEPIKQVI